VKGPRGGLLGVTIDGVQRGPVNEYRAPADPAHPDNSGRKDLTFGTGAITNGGNRTITLGAGGGTIATSGNTQLFLDGKITGSGPLNLSSPPVGSSAIFFGGTVDNDFTGLTTVQTGFVELGAAGHVALSGDVQVNAGGELTINTDEQIATTLAKHIATFYFVKE